jgi:hypothetical protein
MLYVWITLGIQKPVPAEYSTSPIARPTEMEEPDFLDLEAGSRPRTDNDNDDDDGKLI